MALCPFVATRAWGRTRCGRRLRAVFCPAVEQGRRRRCCQNPLVRLRVLCGPLACKLALPAGHGLHALAFPGAGRVPGVAQGLAHLGPHRGKAGCVGAAARLAPGCVYQRLLRCRGLAVQQAARVVGGAQPAVWRGRGLVWPGRLRWRRPRHGRSCLGPCGPGPGRRRCGIYRGFGRWYRCWGGHPSICRGWGREGADGWCRQGIAALAFFCLAVGGQGLGVVAVECLQARAQRGCGVEDGIDRAARAQRAQHVGVHPVFARGGIQGCIEWHGGGRVRRPGGQWCAVVVVVEGESAPGLVLRGQFVQVHGKGSARRCSGTGCHCFAQCRPWRVPAYMQQGVCPVPAAARCCGTGPSTPATRP